VGGAYLPPAHGKNATVKNARICGRYETAAKQANLTAWKNWKTLVFAAYGSAHRGTRGNAQQRCESGIAGSASLLLSAARAAGEQQSDACGNLNYPCGA